MHSSGSVGERKMASGEAGAWLILLLPRAKRGAAPITLFPHRHW